MTNSVQVTSCPPCATYGHGRASEALRKEGKENSFCPISDRQKKKKSQKNIHKEICLSIILQRIKRGKNSAPQNKQGIKVSREKYSPFYNCVIFYRRANTSSTL